MEKLKIKMSKKEKTNRKYERLLLDYQLLVSSLVTYWIALSIGLIIAFITQKLIFGVFFVLVIGMSSLLTISGLFYVLYLRDRINEMIE